MAKTADPVGLIEEHYEDVMRQVYQGHLKWSNPSRFVVWVVDLSQGLGRSLGMALARNIGQEQDIAAYILDCAAAGSRPVQAVVMKRMTSMKLAASIDADIARKFADRVKEGHFRAAVVGPESAHVFDVELPSMFDPSSA